MTKKEMFQQKVKIQKQRIEEIQNIVNIEELQKLSNIELADTVIGVYNNQSSQSTQDIVIVTTAKIYIINVDYIDPITKEVKTIVNSKATTWKRLANLSSRNKREIILNRLIVTEAIYYEQVNNIITSSKYEFMKLFNNVPALTLSEITKQIKTEGESNVDGSEIELDITDDMNTLGIIKFVYNKLKNDSLNVVLLGVENDITYVSFEKDSYLLKFEIGLLKKTVTLKKKPSKRV